MKAYHILHGLAGSSARSIPDPRRVDELSQGVSFAESKACRLFIGGDERLKRVAGLGIITPTDKQTNMKEEPS